MRRLIAFVYDNESYTLGNVQDQQDNFANVVPRTRRVIGSDGGFDEFGTSPAPAEIGNLQAQIVLRVNTQSDMTAKMDNLRKISRGSKGFLYMQMEDDTIRWAKARVNSISTPVSETTHSEYIIRARLAFQLSAPHWYVNNTEEPLWGQFTWGDFVYGGDVTSNAVSGTITGFTVTLGGTVQTLPRIVIACGAGETAENVTIQRLVDGVAEDEITFTDVLIESDSVEVDCGAKSVLKNGVNAFDDFSFDGHPDWIRLQPGDNEIRVVMANGGDDASVAFYFNDVYI